MQFLKIGRQHQLLLFRLLFARVFEHHDLFPYPHIDQIGVAQRFDGIHMDMDGVRPVMGKLKIGRADTQVKHMGHRIELGELETAANSIGFITSAACLYHEQKERLCLFYQAEEQDDKAVFAELKKILPGYMVPNKLVYLEKMPENRTGKIDRVFLRREYLEKM